MSNYNEAFETLLNYLDKNPLLDSFIVYVEDIKEISNIADVIEELPKVVTVKYGEGMVESVISAFDLPNIFPFLLRLPYITKKLPLSFSYIMKI